MSFFTALRTTAFRQRFLAQAVAFSLLSITLAGCNEPGKNPVATAQAFNSSTDQASKAKEFDKARLKLQLAKIDPSLTIKSVESTPMPGIAEVTLEDGQVAFMNAEGTYLFNGSLFKVTDRGLVDLSAAKKNQQIKAIVDVVPSSDMIIYAPKDVKASITVLTDVDCPYCHKLHADIPALNAQGIAVRYMAYPRAGVGSESFKKMQSIWCATDSRMELDLAMSNQPIDKVLCESSPIASQYELGQKLHVTGTPTVILEDGHMQAGYVPVDAMVKRALDAASH